jgi:3-oxoacyl-[acyl-carrier protein] reductase
LQADFSTKEAFVQFAHLANDRKYDVLVTGAVYYAEKDGWEAQQDWDEWQKSFAINVTTNGVLMAHAKMAMQPGGVVINIGSMSGKPHVIETQFGIYRATKAALDSMICTYAKMWAPDIRVVGIAPGWVKSAWNESMLQSDIDAMLAKQGLAKLVEPEEIADMMELCINNESINATTLTIDGGLSAIVL